MVELIVNAETLGKLEIIVAGLNNAQWSDISMLLSGDLVEIKKHYVRKAIEQGFLAGDELEKRMKAYVDANFLKPTQVLSKSAIEMLVEKSISQYAITEINPIVQKVLTKDDAAVLFMDLTEELRSKIVTDSGDIDFEKFLLTTDEVKKLIAEQTNEFLNMEDLEVLLEKRFAEIKDMIDKLVQQGEELKIAIKECCDGTNTGGGTQVLSAMSQELFDFILENDETTIAKKKSKKEYLSLENELAILRYIPSVKMSNRWKESEMVKYMKKLLPTIELKK